MERISERINPLGPIRGVFYGWWLVGLGAIVFALSTVSVVHGITV